MKGQSIEGPTRDKSPCAFCTEKPDEYCHGHCTRFAKWVEQVEQIKENRRQYYQKLEASLSNRNRKGSRW